MTNAIIDFFFLTVSVYDSRKNINLPAIQLSDFMALCEVPN